MGFRVLRCFSLGIILPLALARCAVVNDVDKTMPGKPVPVQANVQVLGAKEAGFSVPQPRATAGFTMATAVRSALGWHPLLSEAAGRVRESGERITEAKAGYLPGVSGGVRSGYDSRQRATGPKVELNAKQVLYDFGKVAGSVQAGRAGEALSRAQFLAAADQLARDTAFSIVEVQRGRRLLDVSQRQINGVAAIAKLVRERTAGGASTESDQVQAASRLEAARSARLQYEMAYQRELTNLANLTGTHAAPADSVPAWLPQACNNSEPDWNSVPAIQVAVAHEERAAAMLNNHRAERLPTVSLEANAAYDLDDDPRRGEREVEYRVGVNVSAPIYHGGASGARLRAASHALESAGAARDNARLSVKTGLQQAGQQVGSLRRLRQSLASRMKLMVRTRDLNRMQYVDLGTRSLLNLLDAEKELHDTELLAVNTEYDLRRLYVTCLYNSGKIRERFGIDAMALRPGLSKP